MECVIGVKFRDFVMVAADMTHAMSIIVMKDDEKKLHKISDKVVMAAVGDPGDAIQFCEYIGKNMQLYKMRNGYDLSPKAAAHFTRRNLADSLRSSSPYNVNLLMAGYDSHAKEAELFFIDYLASCVKVPYACHGYGGFFALTVMDRYHRQDMTQEEAYDLMKKCVREVHKRLIVNLPNFMVQIISDEGIKEMPAITAKNLAVEDAAMA